MRSLNTREKVLLGVLIVGGVAVVLFLGDDRIGLGGKAAKAFEAEGPAGEPPIVRMDLLARATTEFDPDGRDLFKYYVPPKKAPPPPPPKPPPKQVERVVAPPPPVQKAADPRPRPPRPEFRYLGFLGPKESKIAVFDGGQGEGLLLARIGDTIQDEFRLEKFKFDKVILGFTDQKWEGQTAELTMTPE